MKTMGNSNGIKAHLVNVAPNLYRHAVSKEYYGWKKIAGKQRLHALGSADRKTADGKLSEWLRDLAVVDTTAKDLTVGGLLERFLSARAGRKEGTRITENAIANVFKRTFEPGMGTLVARVKASALLTWLSEQGESRNWKNRTYNRRRLFLSQMFGLAVADNAISEVQNPFKTQIIRAKRKEKVFRRIPTPDQFQTIVESIRAQKCNAQHEDSADFVEFLGLAGVGQAEASALRWADVDFDSARINFIRRKTERDYYVPMYDWLRPFMDRLRERAGGKPAHDERVFKIDDAKHALGNACKRLKLPHFTQRNLRAMLIKRLHDAGVNVKLIAKWQGHQDGGRLIMEVYTEVFGDNDAAMEAAELAKAAGKIIPFQAAA